MCYFQHVNNDHFWPVLLCFERREGCSWIMNIGWSKTQHNDCSVLIMLSCDLSSLLLNYINYHHSSKPAMKCLLVVGCLKQILVSNLLSQRIKLLLKVQFNFVKKWSCQLDIFVASLNNIWMPERLFFFPSWFLILSCISVKKKKKRSLSFSIGHSDKVYSQAFFK